MARYDEAAKRVPLLDQVGGDKSTRALLAGKQTRQVRKKQANLYAVTYTQREMRVNRKF